MGLCAPTPNNDCNRYSITDKTVEIFWKILNGTIFLAQKKSPSQQTGGIAKDSSREESHTR